MTTSPSDFDHVMIDIESMSLNQHNALVLSVGLIEFDPTNVETLVIGCRSLLVPELAEQLYGGREVTASTQKWWREQPPAAADHWLNAPDRIPVRSMLNHIRNFCAGKQHIWANGNQFDLANLHGLAEQWKAGDLWHYQAPRDMRTFVRTTPETRKLPDDYDLNLIPHHPVDDSIRQAWGVWSHWSL